MLPKQNIACDFVKIVYVGTLSAFYYLHNHLQDLFLMEDGILLHHSHVSEHWRCVYGINLVVWPTNFPNLNPIENLWKILKNQVH